MTQPKANPQPLVFSLSLALETYLINKAKDKGEACFCPTCGSVFKKYKKEHAFCSNWYSTDEDTQDCKSAFWLALAK